MCTLIILVYNCFCKKAEFADVIVPARRRRETDSSEKAPSKSKYTYTITNTKDLTKVTFSVNMNTLMRYNQLDGNSIYGDITKNADQNELFVEFQTPTANTYSLTVEVLVPAGKDFFPWNNSKTVSEKKDYKFSRKKKFKHRKRPKKFSFRKHSQSR